MGIVNSLDLFIFFKNHPKFPFSQWNNNYDDYVAMNLFLIYLFKSKIPNCEINDWIYLKEYYNSRINDSDGLFYPFGCINHKRQQVINIGIAKESDEENGYASFSISTEKDSFYWEVYKDSVFNLKFDFYYSTNIYFNPKFMLVAVKIEEFLNYYFSSSLDLDGLYHYDVAFFDGDFDTVF